MKNTFDRLLERQPQLFSAADLVVPAATLQATADLIAAIESVIALPAYRAHALAQAPAIARRDCAARGVFMGVPEGWRREGRCLKKPRPAA